MKHHLKRIAIALTAVAVCQAAAAAGLKVFALAEGSAELDLFSTGDDGAYVKSVQPSTLAFPIAILEDRNGGYVIKLDGKKYYVNESNVVTNKVYDVSATECDNTFATERVGATRGIAGMGC